MPKLLRCCLPIIAVLAMPLGATEVVVEPPSPAEMAAKGELMESLFPAEPVAADVFKERLASARKAGVADQLILEAEVFRVFNQRIRIADFDGLASRLDVAAEKWDSGKAVLVDAPELARALAKLLLAKKARLAGDIDAFRRFAAEAVWWVPNLQYLVDDLDAEARRDALVGNPDFAAFNRACDEGNEAAVKRFFSRAYWADAPVSQELAIERLEAFRSARRDTVAVLPRSEWRAPLRGVMAFGRARRATTPLFINSGSL